MSRRSRRNGDSGSNISFIILGGVILAVLITFIVSYLVNTNNSPEYSKTPTTNTQMIASSENNMLNMITNSQAVSSSIGKSVNEMEETNLEITNEANTTKMAVNTSKVEENKIENKENIKNTENSIVSEETTNTQETKNEKTEESVKDPIFVKPVTGEKIQDYSKDNLIYSNTLEEWTTHLGIDYKAEKTDVVKAAADGIIKSIKNDPRYGLTVVIEHTNGFESSYSSLLTAEFITVGEEVKQGQTIATVGNTAVFEIADETHLHFEIKKDGENIDPNIYVN